MDIVALGLAVVWATEKLVELVKPLFGTLKDKVPWQVVSAICGGLLGWAFNVILVPTLIPAINYVLVGIAVSGGSGGWHDLLKLLAKDKEPSPTP
jgi:hypothetical protein